MRAREVSFCHRKLQVRSFPALHRMKAAKGSLSSSPSFPLVNVSAVSLLISRAASAPTSPSFKQWICRSSEPLVNCVCVKCGRYWRPLVLNFYVSRKREDE